LTREVNLTKRIRLADGSTRFAPIVLAANGRVKPDYVLVDGKREHHPEGRYYLDWTEGDKRIRKSVGKDPSKAAAERHRKEQFFAAKAAGVQVVETSNSARLLAAVTVYLDEIKSTKKSKTHAAYKTALDYFTECCTKATVQEIQRADLLKFSAFLRDKKKLSPRTCWNKFSNVMSFLKAQGIRGLVHKNDWPRYVEEEPEVYEREDLDKFFAACDDEERLWFEFFLMTGMREQEVMHTYWDDVSLPRNTVTVRYKKEYGFSPKNYKEREIPIPNKLAQALKDWKKSHASAACPLLFPTSGCKPKLNFLDDCRAVAERAKLNPDDFWLHKFRATFATWSLWAGVDLRTVQQWMGHTDMESTMRYLKPNRSQAVREKVNEIFA
jgi:integrase/recombinase XerD